MASSERQDTPTRVRITTACRSTSDRQESSIMPTQRMHQQHTSEREHRDYKGLSSGTPSFIPASSAEEGSRDTLQINSTQFSPKQQRIVERDIYEEIHSDSNLFHFNTLSAATTESQRQTDCVCLDWCVKHNLATTTSHN